jgi:hypothetical protein
MASKLLRRISFILLGIIAAILIATLALLAFLVIGEIYFPLKDKHRERVFNELITQKIEAGERQIFLKDLTDFNWDRVCYFTSQYGDGGASYPTPDEVIGRKFEGYAPDASCDSFGHSDLLFYSDKTAKFVRFDFCNTKNLCRTQSFGDNLHCCTSAAFLSYEVENRAGVKNYRFYLNDRKPGTLPTP